MTTTVDKWNKWRQEEKRPLTIRYLFTLTRPTLLNAENGNPGSGWRNDYIRISHDDVETWDDFEEGNINAALYRAIDHEAPFHYYLKDYFANMDKPTGIGLEEDMDQYFVDNIRPIINHAIAGTRELLLEATGNPHAGKLMIPFQTQTVGVSLPEHKGAARRQKRPNFPIYLPAKAMPRLTPDKDVIYVVGDTARINSLDPACFEDSEDFRASAQAHIGKMAMYAKGAGTCLGFTMTSFGVTVYRFFIVDGSYRWGVQQRSFPWCPEWVALPNENPMSGIKAIYALTVMSLLSGGRELKERSELLSVADLPRL